MEAVCEVMLESSDVGMPCCDKDGTMEGVSEVFPLELFSGI